MPWGSLNRNTPIRRPDFIMGLLPIEERNPVG